MIRSPYDLEMKGDRGAEILLKTYPLMGRLQLDTTEIGDQKPY